MSVLPRLCLLACLLLFACQADHSAAVQKDIQQAKSYLAMSQGRAAEEILLHALSLQPENEEASFLRAKAFEQLEEWPAAYVHYYRLAARFPDHSVYAEAALRLEIMAHRWDDAEQRLQALDAKGLAPQRSRYWHAKILASQGKKKQAWQMLQTIVQQLDEAQQLDVVSWLLSLSMPDEALQVLAGLPKTSVDVQFMSAKALLAKGQRQACMQRLQSLLAVNPEHAQASMLLGFLYEREQQWQQAASVYRALLIVSPKQMAARLRLGQLLAYHDRLDELLVLMQGFHASSAIDEGIENFFQGLIAMQQRHVPQALNAFRKATLLLPEHADVWFAYAQALFAHAEWSKAKASYSKALELDPSMTRAHLQIASIDDRQGDTSAARARLLRVLARQPGLAEARLLLIDVALHAQHAKQALQQIQFLLPRVHDRQVGEHLQRLHVQALTQLGRYDEALRLIQQLAAVQEDDAYRLMQADVYLRQNRLLDAKQVLDRIDVLHTPMALSMHAVLALRLGQLEQAKQWFQKAMQDPKQKDTAALNLARLAMDAKQWQQAEAYLQALSTHAAVLLRAQLAQRQQQWSKAVALYQQLSRAGDMSVPVQLGLAESLLMQGHADKAAELFRRLRNRSQSPRVARGLAAAMAASSSSSALSVLNKLIAKQPDDADARVQRGQWYLQHGRLKEARADCRQARTAQPRHADALICLLDVAMQEHQTDLALSLLSDALRDHADDVFLLGLQGQLLYQLKRWDEAETVLQRAHDLSPDQAAVQILLARLALQHQQPDRAIGILEKLLAQASLPLSASLEAMMLKAETLQGQGKDEQALRLYDQILERQPKHVAAHNNMALLLLQQHKPAEALLHARRAYAEASRSLAVRDTLALCYLQTGKVADAVRMMRQTLALQPENEWLQLHLAQGLYLLGDDAAVKKLVQPLLEQTKDAQIQAKASALL